MDDTTENGMPPKFVAERIVRCLFTKETDLLICSFLHRLVVNIRLYAPALYFTIMKIRTWNSRRKAVKED